MYSSEEENVEIVEFIADPERQILQEGNQVKVLPKWDLKPVYCNLIWVMDFTLKFSVHNDGDDKYIMIQCLSVTFLFIPALLPSPVQSCYDWIKRKVESRK